MDLNNIIHIANKVGLYKIISKSKKIIIVESIIDKKKMPVLPTMQANMLNEIGIYTENETIPIIDVFKKISEHENYQLSIDHKASRSELTEYFMKIVPEYDKEKVYISDIKKVIRWYNLLQKYGIIKKENIKKNEKKNTSKIT